MECCAFSWREMLFYKMDQLNRELSIIQIEMMSNYQLQELEQLKSITLKKNTLQNLKNEVKSHQMALKRELNISEAIHNLFTSPQYQQLLESTNSRIEEFEAVKNDYEQLPEDGTGKLEKLKLSNEERQDEVWNLEQRIQHEKEREKRIEASIRTFEEAIDAQIIKKSLIQNDISNLKTYLNHSVNLKQSIMSEFAEISGEMSKEEAELLNQEKFDQLVRQYTLQIKDGNVTQFRNLTEMAEKYICLQQLRNRHQSAQRVFNHYSRLESEPDLIKEQARLKGEIEEISQKIEVEKQTKSLIQKQCEENVRKEAISNVNQWVTHRLNDIIKKKKTIIHLLQVITLTEVQPSQERRQIQQQLHLLEQEQQKLREKINEQEMQV